MAAKAQDSQDNLVEIMDLVVEYPNQGTPLRAVDHVSLEVKRGEVLGLVGESGCGKTTLGLTLLRMNAPGRVTGGSVQVDSVDILSLGKEELRRYRWEKTSMVFQSAMNALDPVKTIESQIVETMVQHSNTNKEAARRKVRDLLSIVHIDPTRATSYPHELSGGMKQRVVIAMALCLSPKLLIADEPTTALDVVVQAGILRTIKRLQEEMGLSVIIITHDISIMSEMSNRIAVMYGGKIVEIGPTKDILESPMHPYTQALLRAIPDLGDKATIKGIPGAPPNLADPPKGCRFHPRCPHAFERCRNESPELIDAGPTMAACWLVEKDGV
ncbi:MAG: ABC transporter ATP-binding protein [Thaumarchaeota archaeon]|nr:ABC transporter ATP-binding protein [Nitrososphaerota archaeon]